MTTNPLLARLRHHVSGAIERGEAEPITEITYINEYERIRLQHALLGDFRSLSIAYPILADHGYMERTANGYVAIDPHTVKDRIIKLLKGES